MEKEKIRFKDLNGWLETGVIIGCYLLFWFLVGIAVGIIGEI